MLPLLVLLLLTSTDRSSSSGSGSGYLLQEEEERDKGPMDHRRRPYDLRTPKDHTHKHRRGGW